MTALEEIKKALEGVTPGPWERGSDEKGGHPLWVYCDDVLGTAICGQDSDVNHTARDQRIRNLEYIAAVNPVAIAELLSTLESLQRENERLAKDVKEMRDRYEHWMPVTEKMPDGMSHRALLEFYCVKDDAEDEDSPEYWQTATWDEKPEDAVFWCAIVTPLGPRETTFIARQALASTGGDHNADK